MAEASAITSIPEISFPFKIANISKLESAWSTEVKVHDIPWQIHIKKVTLGEEQCLSVYLHCAIKDKSPDWSHAAFAIFKLVPFSGNKIGIECQIEPYVFDCSGFGYGFSSFIKWNELINPANCYVKDDTLTLNIKIVAADPNDKNPSKVLLETILKCCDDSYYIKYRLNITNIDKLMAAKSPQFKMRNSPWYFILRKESSYLGVYFENRASSADYSCHVQMLLKLISSKNEIKPIEPAAQDKLFKKGNILVVTKFVSWVELMKPENGFVNNNSIVIEVEIKANHPEGVVPNNRNAPKLLKLECAICLEVFSGQEISSTQCGHLFCSPCIKNSIEARGKCPSCNVGVTLESLHRVYLPIAN